MSKKVIVEAVAREAGMTQAAADKVVSAVLEAVSSELAAGNKVAFPGFGTFEVREDGDGVFVRVPDNADETGEGANYAESDGCYKQDHWKVFWFGADGFERIRSYVEHCAARAPSLEG